jgi:hypothetical protein
MPSPYAGRLGAVSSADLCFSMQLLCIVIVAFFLGRKFFWFPSRLSYFACALFLCCFSRSPAFAQGQWIVCRQDGSTSVSFYAQIAPYQDGSGSVIVAYPSPLSSVGFQRVHGQSVIVGPSAISFKYDLVEMGGRYEINLNRENLRYSSKLWARIGSSLVSDRKSEKSGLCSLSGNPFSSSGRNNQL